MRSFLTVLAQSTSVLCAILFTFALSLTVLLINSETILFNAATYKTALERRNLYARIPDLLAKQIISDLTTPSGSAAYLKYLSLDDWELLINTLVPPKQIRIITEQTLDSLFNFLNGKNQNPVIPITTIKKSLVANSSTAVNRILGAQPACTPEQLTDIVTSVLAGQPVKESMLCNLPANVIKPAMPLMTSVFEAQVAALPDAIPFFEQSPIEKRDLLMQVRMLARASPLLPLILLTILTLFSVRSLSGLLKWWGIPLCVSGAFTLILALLAAPLIQYAIANGAAGDNTFLVRGLATTGLDILQVVIGMVTLPVAIQASVIFLVGLAMTITAWAVRKK
jgi:hypothetical protein